MRHLFVKIVCLWWEEVMVSFSYPSISGVSDISLSARSLNSSALEVNVKDKMTKHTSLMSIMLPKYSCVLLYRCFPRALT